MFPHLTQDVVEPLLALERRFLASAPEIERWFRSQWQEHTPPFYGSVDLRNAGFKLAPIDMNLFPGGFNNLHADFMPLCVQAAMSAVEKICPEARRILLIPENHTRNLFYLQNVAQIVTLLKMTGVEVRLGTLIPEIDRPTKVDLPNGQSLLLEPLVRRGSRLGLADFDPCMVLLNNDLSAGIPDILKGLNEQFLLPPLHAGWAVRRKSKHFSAYDEVANNFARLIGIDPWQINPYFSVCQSVNFHERQGEECLAANVEGVLTLIREKYEEYGIRETPYVVVKADAGTYGMAVMTAKSVDEVIGLNRRQRNKMAVAKEGLNVTEVIIQEGVHTLERVEKDGKSGVAEPVVYMIDRFVVGGFYRVHDERGIDENLNAPGMHFEPLPFETSCYLPDECENPDAPRNRFYAYGVMARLALLAASLELERTA